MLRRKKTTDHFLFWTFFCECVYTHCEPILHHTWWHSSETSIHHHCWSYVVGMSFSLPVCQSSFHQCTIIWRSRNCAVVDCNVVSHSDFWYHRFYTIHEQFQLKSILALFGRQIFKSRLSKNFFQNAAINSCISSLKLAYLNQIWRTLYCAFCEEFGFQLEKPTTVFIFYFVYL